MARIDSLYNMKNRSKNSLKQTWGSGGKSHG